jgi:hypothetical protein
MHALNIAISKYALGKVLVVDKNLQSWWIYNTPSLATSRENPGQ